MHWAILLFYSLIVCCMRYTVCGIRYIVYSTIYRILFCSLFICWLLDILHSVWCRSHCLGKKLFPDSVAFITPKHCYSVDIFMKETVYLCFIRIMGFNTNCAAFRVFMTTDKLKILCHSKCCNDWAINGLLNFPLQDHARTPHYKFIRVNIDGAITLD